MLQVNEKYCSNCKSLKEKNEFNKCNAGRDGLQIFCKQCHRVINKRNMQIKRASGTYIPFEIAHPEKILFSKKAKAANSVAKKYGLPGKLSWRDIKKLFATYDKCLSCGSKEKLSLDHVKPFRLGGFNIYSNLQVLCFSCNASKNAHEIDYRK